jgi:hypothetical protein
MQYPYHMERLATYGSEALDSIEHLGLILRDENRGQGITRPLCPLVIALLRLVPSGDPSPQYDRTFG